MSGHATGPRGMRRELRRYGWWRTARHRDDGNEGDDDHQSTEGQQVLVDARDGGAQQVAGPRLTPSDHRKPAGNLPNGDVRAGTPRAPGEGEDGTHHGNEAASTRLCRARD